MLLKSRAAATNPTSVNSSALFRRLANVNVERDRSKKRNSRRYSYVPDDGHGVPALWHFPKRSVKNEIRIAANRLSRHCRRPADKNAYLCCYTAAGPVRARIIMIRALATSRAHTHIYVYAHVTYIYMLNIRPRVPKWFIGPYFVRVRRTLYYFCAYICTYTRTHEYTHQWQSVRHNRDNWCTLYNTTCVWWLLCDRGGF